MDPLQNNGEEDAQCAEEEEEEVDPRIQVRLCFSSPNRSRCCHQWKWHWGEHVEPNDKKCQAVWSKNAKVELRKNIYRE